MKKWIFAIILFLSFTSAFAMSDDETAAKTVIENWFSAMKANDIDKAASYLAPQFVSIHTDGKVRDKEQEIDLIKKLEMKDYHLTEFKFSSSGDVIVVTYKDKGQEKIDDKPIGKKAAGRMAVLQKQNDQWLILAYANMDKLK